jgi:hypothetical protein
MWLKCVLRPEAGDAFRNRKRGEKYHKYHKNKLYEYFQKVRENSSGMNLLLTPVLFKYFHPYDDGNNFKLTVFTLIYPPNMTVLNFSDVT